MSNIVDAYPREGVVFRTKPMFQWDYGQIVRLNISDLPASYKVEFSNSTRADAVATVQSTDEVAIPAQFLENGNPIYAWVVVVDEARTTEYSLIIPVSARAKPTDQEPAPEEQTEIEQTLSALNQAVSNVQEIADAIPDTINEALEAAKESGEFDGKDGYTPVKGVDYFDGKDGIDGKDGKDGKDGADGYTPQKGIDYFDGEDGKDGKDGKDGADGQPGPAGTPGISPSITITDITGGHRVTITDATGQHSFDVMDGEDGQGSVQDVQVNGASVVQDGVANVPVANGNNRTAGVVYPGGQIYGLTMSSAYPGMLYVYAAEPNDIKAASSYYKSVVPGRQDASTFYGLAKAAGDTTQSASSNAVGNYTEQAKSAISTMLNGPVTVSGTTPTITALPGIQYICGEVSTLDITLPASGCVDVVFDSGATPTVLTVTPPSGVTLKWANGFDPTALNANTTYEINIADGLGVVGSWT